MNCRVSIYRKHIPFVTIVYDESPRKLNALKNMKDFCGYSKIEFFLSKIEDYAGSFKPPLIGMIIDNKFIPYEFFKKNRVKIANFIEEVKEACGIANLGLGGGL